MRYTVNHRVDVADVGMDGTIRPDAITRLFQNAAVEHSDHAGFSAERLHTMERVWVLSSFGFDMSAPVNYRDELIIETWSRGVEKFRGFRDYLIRRNGDVVCRATSTWLYLNTVRKRPARAAEDIGDAYGIDSARGLDIDIDTLLEGAPEISVFESIGTRRSDFDLNGHMNNTSYVACIETAAVRIDPESTPLARFVIKFAKEVKPECRTVDVGIARHGDRHDFCMMSGDCVHASGFYTTAPK